MLTLYAKTISSKAFTCNLNSKLYAKVLYSFVHPFSQQVYSQNELKMHQDNSTTHSGAAKLVLNDIGVPWVT